MTTFTYDARGRQVTATDETGADTETVYAAVTGQVTQVLLPPSVPNGPRGYISYAYANGHPFETQYPGGEKVRNSQYDSGGRVHVQQRLAADGTTVTGTTTMTYDTAGRLITLQQVVRRIRDRPLYLTYSL